jgi:hypothetical protein
LQSFFLQSQTCPQRPIPGSIALVTALLLGLTMSSGCRNETFSDYQAPAPAKSQLQLWQGSALSRNRVLRRIHLDLRAQIPTSAEYEAANATSFDAITLINTLLSGDSAAESIAALIVDSMPIASDQIPMLERFEASSNPGISGWLDQSAREQISREVTATIAAPIRQNLPFPTILNQTTIATSSNLASQWGWTEAGTLWSDPDTIVSASPPLSSAGLGLLRSPAFLAYFDTERADDPSPRTYRLIEELFCGDFSSNSAHHFASETHSTDTTDWSQEKSLQANCASCHDSIEDFSAALQELPDDTTFESWSEAQSSQSLSGKNYFGTALTASSNIASLISNDERFSRCMLVKLSESLTQRDFNINYDSQSLILAQSLYDTYEQDIRTAIRILLFSSAYTIEPLAADESESVRYALSGIRQLKRRQLEGIYQQYIGSTYSSNDASQLELHHQSVGHFNHITPAYWQAYESWAVAFAQGFVTAEVSRSASGRLLFTALSDPFASSLSEQDVLTQIIALATGLNGEVYDSESTYIKDLLSLWNGSQQLGEDTTTSWQTLLLTLLLTPEFMRY